MHFLIYLDFSWLCGTSLYHSEEVQVAFICCDFRINPMYSLFSKATEIFPGKLKLCKTTILLRWFSFSIVLQLGFVWRQGVWASWLINYWRGDFSVFISQSTLPWACLSFWHKRSSQSAQFQRLQTSWSMIILVIMMRIIMLRRGVRSYVQCGCNVLAKFWRLVGCSKSLHW